MLFLPFCFLKTLKKKFNSHRLYGEIENMFYVEDMMLLEYHGRTHVEVGARKRRWKWLFGLAKRLVINPPANEAAVLWIQWRLLLSRGTLIASYRFNAMTGVRECAAEWIHRSCPRINKHEIKQKITSELLLWFYYTAIPIHGGDPVLHNFFLILSILSNHMMITDS